MNKWQWVKNRLTPRLNSVFPRVEPRGSRSPGVVSWVKIKPGVGPQVLVYVTRKPGFHLGTVFFGGAFLILLLFHVSSTLKTRQMFGGLPLFGARLPLTSKANDIGNCSVVYLHPTLA